MGRRFDQSLSQQLVGSGIQGVGDNTWTMAGWVLHDDVTTATSGGAFCLFGTAGANEYAGIEWQDSNQNRSVSRDAGGIRTVDDSTAKTADVWYHFVIRHNSTGNHSYFFNGVDQGSIGKGTSLWDQVSIGSFDRSTGPVLHFEGVVAEVAVWNHEMSQGDITSLAGGAVPSTVAVANIEHYWPLLGTQSPEPDSVGTVDLTLVNGPTQGPHPFGPTKQASVRLADLNGNDRANVASVPWRWYDGLPISGLGPTDTGTGATDGTGNMTVNIPNSTLNAGGVGYLLIDTGAWQSIHAVTVTES